MTRLTQIPPEAGPMRPGAQQPTVLSLKTNRPKMTKSNLMFR